ncbi:MAG: glycosyl transferase group 1 [Desulfitobacteriaceae bacterium]|nr:glycosyl transferase group 1 [Desulfitobacteriaceae bacterium]MDD4345285.1 glycosyl transferase group 1 [Desulfitobacteriaceae bacterium]MDD4400467.1 glycosyl transferase group 1 [Desulfitobacteriaceae bacterium]
MQILFIACYSPFINNSAAIETLQYLNQLSNDNEVHLLTVDFPKNSIYYDENHARLMSGNIKVHAISGGKLLEILMPKAAKIPVNQPERKFFNLTKVLKKLKKVLELPDMYIYWAFKAARYGKKLCHEIDFKVIFSMHEPPSSHICAYLIKKKHPTLSWVSYWSDPWFKDPGRINSYYLKKKVNQYFEEKAVRNSDKLIFVTDINRRDFIDTYELVPDTCFLLTRGYDKVVYDRLRKENKPDLIENNKINIIYAGEIFHQLRNSNPFIDVIEELKKERNDLYEKLNILFFGNIDDDNVKKRLISNEIIKVLPRITFGEALKYLLNSDILLLFGNKNSKQIPAKIYDYFGTNSWILVIYGDKNDPLIPLTKGHYKCYGVNNESIAIKNALLELITRVKAGKHSKEDSSYEWGNIGDRLFKILGD